MGEGVADAKKAFYWILGELLCHLYPFFSINELMIDYDQGCRD